MKKFFLLVLLFGGALLFFQFKGKDKAQIVEQIRSWMGAKKKYPPGILVESPPKLGSAHSMRPWKKGPFVITPVAQYSVQCRVLQKWVDLKSTEYQRQIGELGRVEAALAWGSGSDQDVVDHIVFFWQQGWYFIKFKDGFDKYRWDEIRRNMCYARLIAEPDVEEKLVSSIGAGDMVEINGFLVNAIHEGGHLGFSSPADNDFSDDKVFRYIWVNSVKKL